MDLTLYWFMFPVSMCVATIAMLSGIGGAALFTPIFLIIFPLLGPEYPLASPVAAIGVALLTETFGFSSGFIGYYRKRLIDFRGAVQFIALGVPVAIVGALLAQSAEPNLLKGAYALLMLVLAAVLIRHTSHHEAAAPSGDLSVGAADNRPKRTITGRDGQVFTFVAPRQGIGAIATSIGALLTGLLSVGIGEVVMPQLVKRNRVPVPVAAATSVLVVIVVVASASFTQITSIVAEGGVSAVPWNLVMYTVPGVILGGQIGPRLQGKVSSDGMVRFIAVLFAIIGVAMAWIVLREVF